MAEDRHRHKSRSVRIPSELVEWLPVQAAIEGRKQNAVIVAALREYRENHGHGVIVEPPRRQVSGEAYRAPVFAEPIEERAPCRHPAESVVAGECCLCGADVW